MLQESWTRARSRAMSTARAAGVGRLVYHSVASPYVPEMPHHLGKAVSEDLIRTSGLAWTVLQPGAYLQNLDLGGPTVRVPYDVDAPFGFLDLADLGEAAATVLLADGHTGATYELASRQATVRELATEHGLTAERVAVELLRRSIGSARFARTPDPGSHPWLTAMFAYYDRHGLPVGTLPLRALLGDRPQPMS